jgi:transaldolase
MKIFIDSANIEEIKKAVKLNLVDGVTTNPSLIAKEGKELRPTIIEITKIVDGPISVEVIATTAEEMLKEGEEYASWHKNIVVKVPLTDEGLKAVKIFTEKNIKTNVTLCFSPLQALLAAKAGATYISPFIGRLDDIATDGVQLICDIKTIYQNYNFKTQILAASIRHPIHILEAAKIGADVCTVPYKVIEQILKHPLTDIGLKNFLSDWEKLKK